jgi:hypothetical protein
MKAIITSVLISNGDECVAKLDRDDGGWAIEVDNNGFITSTELAFAQKVLAKLEHGDEFKIK